ncbi:MAG: E3 binding domain-containing protein, partial [Alphaproteobacteria bacterium]|nr:E3 binding domain-containing protein [Alphaproteobacteria bacterium]
MPSLGADMEAGTLVEWLKKPGDAVARGDVIAVVETQKGAIEIESFQPGILESLLATPGQKLAVGAPMAFIRAAGETGPAPVAPAAPVIVPKPAAAPAAVPVPPPHGLALPSLRVSPAARRRAEELGVDLARVAGSGPGGAITVADVEAAAVAAPKPAAPVPLAGMREVIGAAMARSKREIPHYYLGHTIHLEPALKWLEAENSKRPVPERVLYGALLLK